MPEIELNNKVNDGDIHNGDEDYCDTCGERNMCCNCLPPQWRWKPVGYDIVIPKKIESDDY